MAQFSEKIVFQKWIIEDSLFWLSDIGLTLLLKIKLNIIIRKLAMALQCHDIVMATSRNVVVQCHVHGAQFLT